MISETYSISRDVEKEFRSTYETILSGRGKQMKRCSIRHHENSIHSAVSAVTELREKMDLIGQFIESITDIASQTNMLALNAAISGKSRESGKGFSVVVEEIRQLAEQSSGQPIYRK